jgi:hypothetical protein
MDYFKINSSECGDKVEYETLLSLLAPRHLGLGLFIRIYNTRERRVSFGQNTDPLSKRHEATAKTNPKCLLSKQLKLVALFNANTHCTPSCT